MLTRIVSCLFGLSLSASQQSSFDIVKDCGAVGDNRTISTSSIQACLDKAAAVPGGGTVIVPSGVFLTGTVTIGSNVLLSFLNGGFLQGSSNPSLYSSDWDYWHVVQSVNASNVTISAETRGGGGIVGAMWQMIASYDESQEMWKPANWEGVDGCVGECRPKNIALIDVTNASLLNIALLYSSDWTMLLRRCHNLVLDSLVIEGSQAWPNGDGMDIESGSNISLLNLEITTGDDSIAMRSGNANSMKTPWLKPLPPLDGVTIRNCTLSSSSAAIKVENLFEQDHGNVSNILAEDIVIRGSNRGIGIWQRISGPSGGWMGNFTFRNISIQTEFMYGTNWWGSGEALVVTSIPENAAQSSVGLPGIHNVTFQDIVAVAENGCLFSSLGQQKTNPRAIEGLTLSNINLTILRWPGDNSTHALRDYRPIDSDGPVPNTIPSLVDGFVFENVASASILGGSIQFVGQRQPYWGGPGFEGLCINATASSKVSQAGFSCTLAPPGGINIYVNESI